MAAPIRSVTAERDNMVAVVFKIIILFHFVVSFNLVPYYLGSVSRAYLPSHQVGRGMC